MKKILKCFWGFTPNPHQGSAIDLGEPTHKKCDNKVCHFLFQLFNDAWGRKGLWVKKDFLK